MLLFDTPFPENPANMAHAHLPETRIPGLDLHVCY